MSCTKIVIYFHLLIFSVTSLTSFQTSDLEDFIEPYFKGNFFGPSSTKLSSYPIFTGLLNAFLLVTFIYFHILVLYQQHYSSALRIPSGTSTDMAILWNYLRILSHYMLRVERGRWRRETLKYWEMSNIRVMMNFTSLLSIIISVSFIVSICIWHLITVFAY